MTVEATDKTSGQGADYAITAHFVGGALLQAHTNPILPTLGETVQLTAELQLPGQAVQIETAQAAIRRPDGGVETVALTANGAQAQAAWKPTAPGLYGIDLSVTGQDASGAAIERVAFLAIEAQPEVDPGRAAKNLAIIGAGGAVAAIVLFALGRLGLRRLRRARQ